MSAGRGRDGVVPAELLPLFVRAMRERLDRTGVVPFWLAVLLHVWGVEEIAEGELARQLAIRPAKLSPVLDRLARDHLIRRQESGGPDGDALVSLSHRMRVVRSLLAGTAEEVTGVAFDGLGQEERKALDSAMRHAVERLERDIARRTR